MERRQVIRQMQVGLEERRRMPLFTIRVEIPSVDRLVDYLEAKQQGGIDNIEDRIRSDSRRLKETLDNKIKEMKEDANRPNEA